MTTTWSLAARCLQFAPLRSITLKRKYHCCSHHKCPLLAGRTLYIVARYGASAKNDIFANRGNNSLILEV